MRKLRCELNNPFNRIEIEIIKEGKPGMNILIMLSDQYISHFAYIGNHGLERNETGFPQNGVDYDSQNMPLISGVDII